ncbi:hypothetical protein HN011_006352 [Eciton burchellii]|nr:hypothetical protein HN011_006352 [Eciton burchellii]
MTWMMNTMTVEAIGECRNSSRILKETRRNVEGVVAVLNRLERLRKAASCTSDVRIADRNHVVQDESREVALARKVMLVQELHIYARSVSGDVQFSVKVSVRTEQLHASDDSPLWLLSYFALSEIRTNDAIVRSSAD